MNTKKKCILCGKEYEYCMRCAQYKHLPLWYNLFDGEACHEVYHAIDKYKAGAINAEKAKKTIEKYGIKTVKPQFRDTYNEIMGVEEVAKPKRSKIVKED